MKKYSKTNYLKAAVAAVLLFFCFETANAKTDVQSINLHPGWNAIFLEVEPDNPEPSSVFSGLSDLLSVWTWNPRTSVVEFIQDPNNLLPDNPEMMVYIPGNPIVTNLNAINGGRAYLINLGGSQNQTLTVSGEPRIPDIQWKPNSYNFVGFHLEAGIEPFFESFFASSPALAGQDIYILSGSGVWEKVMNPLTTQMKQGEGFWIYCKGSSFFQGPVSVQTEQGGGLGFGTILDEQEIKIKNHSSHDKTILLSMEDSSFNLYYWVFKPSDNLAGWEKFPSGGQTLDVTIPAGKGQALRLGVKRAGLTAGTAYETNLTITDSEGTYIKIPAGLTGISYAGLWTGYATIKKVNQPPDNTLQPAGSEFSFRLILHAGGSGSVRLLSQVIQMWQEGTWKPDPNDLGNLIVDEPGSFVLFSDDALVAQYSAAALRDGQPVGRRISAPAFPNLTVSEGVMTGSAAPGGSVLNPSEGNDLYLSILLEADDETNPFRHMYHPDHKNIDQSYQVTRNIVMTFSETDTDNNVITGVPTLNWGGNQIGGVYSETIQGLHKDNVIIEGTFILNKVCAVEELTTH